MNLHEVLGGVLGGSRQFLFKMSLHAAQDRGYPEVILTHDSFRAQMELMQYADFAYTRNDDRKWICLKNRETGITGGEPERWQMAQWLLEAQRI